MTLRFAIAGGGTGGHVTPALALAEVMRAAGDAVLFVGTSRGIERRLVPEAGFELVTLDSRPFIGRSPVERLRALLALARGALAARRVLRDFRADLVVSVGGYASAPPALAAALSGIPMVLVNTDAVPGAANRLLARFARRLFAGFESTAAQLGRGPGDPRVQVTGVPLRAALRAAFARAGEVARGPDAPLRLFAFGGSQGARQINDGMLAALADLDPARVEIFHQTGESDRERVAAGYAAAGFRAQVVAFERDMPARYAWADLVICRAGAISVAELALAGRPALLVPLAHTGGGEQFANAEELVAAGAARVVDSRGLDAAGFERAFRDALAALVADRDGLVRMGRAAAGRAHPEAAEAIVAACHALVAEGR